MNRESWWETGPNPAWEGTGKASLRDDSKLGLETDKDISKSITGRGSKVGKMWR